jgi:phage tail sheath protein FI
MAEYRSPGVTVTESLRARDTGTTYTGVARPVIVGPTARGPLEMTTVGTWSQFVSLFGDWSDVPAASATEYEVKQMIDAAYTYFSNTPTGGAPLSVLRVIDPDLPTATASLDIVDTTFTGTAPEKVAFTIGAVSPGVWGNAVKVFITKPIAAPPAGGASDADLAKRFSILVEVGGQVVETHKNLSLSTNDRAYCGSVVNGYSEYIRLTNIKENGTHTVPANLGTFLTGGNDGNAPESSEYSAALEILDSNPQPLTLCAPGIVDQSIVNAVINYAAARGDCFAVVSAPDLSPSELDVDGVQYWASALVKSPYAAVYYPDVVIPDPQSGPAGILRTASNAGAVLGAYSANDVQVGIWRTPAGTSAYLRGISGPSRLLKQTELDSLNSGYNPINVIRRVNTVGPCIMGGRTLDQRSSDRYVGIRRSMSFIRASLTDLLEYALFEVNGEDLWADVTVRVENFLGLYFQRGALRGSREPDAFYVTCNGTNNTASTVASGELHLTVGVAVEYPAEFVVINLVQHQESVRS